jgi:hypothetical protein
MATVLHGMAKFVAKFAFPLPWDSLPLKWGFVNENRMLPPLRTLRRRAKGSDFGGATYRGRVASPLLRRIGPQRFHTKFFTGEGRHRLEWRGTGIGAEGLPVDPDPRHFFLSLGATSLHWLHPVRRHLSRRPSQWGTDPADGRRGLPRSTFWPTGTSRNCGPRRSRQCGRLRIGSGPAGAG